MYDPYFSSMFSLLVLVYVLFLCMYECEVFVVVEENKKKLFSIAVILALDTVFVKVSRVRYFLHK